MTNVLNNSILGTLYRWWLGSLLFALLRRGWHALRRAGAGSRILGAAFGETKLDALFSASALARALRAVLRGVTRILGAITGAARSSVILRGLRGVVRGSFLLQYESLFGAFCCVMFLVPHENWNNLWAALGATALLLLYLLRCAARGEQPVGPDALGLGFTLFVLACVLSMLYTTDFGDSLRILVLFLGAFLLCWLIAVSFDTPQALRRLLGFLYLCLLAVSFMGIMQRALGLVQINRLYTDLSINKGVPARIDATLDNPNNLSAFLQFFLPLGAAFAGGADKSWKRVLLGLGLLIPAVALVMTYSRAGWIAVMLSAAVFVWCCNKRLIPALVILAILALPLLPQSVLTRLSTIFDARDTSRNHRLYIWGGVSDLLRDRGYWLTGIGLGPKTFQNIYPAYAHQFGEGGTYQSQMLYMELDLEMGILGFLSFLWMTLKYMGRAGRGLARSDRATRLVLIAALAGFVALFVSGTVEYQWFYQRIIYAYFIFFGIAIAAVRTAERGTAPCAA